jgi:hypothetical protein
MKRLVQNKTNLILKIFGLQVDNNNYVLLITPCTYGDIKSW